jgi:hypothetical protein
MVPMGKGQARTQPDPRLRKLRIRSGEAVPTTHMFEFYPAHTRQMRGIADRRRIGAYPPDSVANGLPHAGILPE